MKYKYNSDDTYNKTCQKCVCGAKRSFIYCKEDVLTCHICGKNIYRNTKIRFRKEMEKRLRNANRNGSK